MPNPQKILRISERAPQRGELVRLNVRGHAGDVLIEGHVSKNAKTQLEALRELAERSNGMLRLKFKKSSAGEYVYGLEVYERNGKQVANIEENSNGGLQFYENNGLAAVVNGKEVVFLGLHQTAFKSGTTLTAQFDEYLEDVRIVASSVDNLMKYGKESVLGFHNSTAVSDKAMRDLQGKAFSEYFTLTSDAIAANNLILHKDSFASFNVADVFVSANSQLLRTAYEFGRGQDMDATFQPFSQLGLPAILSREIAGEVERKNNSHRDYWERKRERANLRIARGLGIVYVPSAAVQGLQIFDTGAAVIPLMARCSTPKRTLAEMQPANVQQDTPAGKIAKKKEQGGGETRRKPATVGAAAQTQIIPQAGERQAIRVTQTHNAKNTAPSGQRKEKTERANSGKETRAAKPKPLLDEKPSAIKVREPKKTGTKQSGEDGKNAAARSKLHAPKKEAKKGEAGNAEPYKRNLAGEKPAGKRDAEKSAGTKREGRLKNQNHDSEVRSRIKEITRKRPKKSPVENAPHAPAPSAANAKPKKAKQGNAEARQQEKPAVKERQVKANAKKTVDKTTEEGRKSQAPEGKTKTLVRDLVGNLAKKTKKRSSEKEDARSVDGQLKAEKQPKAGKNARKNRSSQVVPAAHASAKANRASPAKNDAHSTAKAAADKEKIAGSKGFLGGNVPTGKKPEPLTYGLRVRRSGQAELRAPDDKTTDLPKTDKRSKTILTERNKKGGANRVRGQQKGNATSAFQADARVPAQSSPAVAPAKIAQALPAAKKTESKKSGFGLISPFAVLRKVSLPSDASAKAAVEKESAGNGKDKKKKAAKTRREIAKAPSSSSSGRPRAIRPAA